MSYDINESFNSIYTFTMSLPSTDSEASQSQPTLNVPLDSQSTHLSSPATVSVLHAPHYATVFASHAIERPSVSPAFSVSRKVKICVPILLVLVAAAVAAALFLGRASDENNTCTPTSDDDMNNAFQTSNKNISSESRSSASSTGTVSVREASDPMLGCIYVREGALVARGRDWEWGNQDGGAGSIGTVIQDLSSSESDGWVEVMWASSSNWYRITGGYCDLRLLDTRNNVITVGDWVYSTVTDVPVSSSSVSAHRHYLPVPSGWEIAPDSSQSRAAISQFRWSTHVAVMASGVGIRTTNFPPAGVEFGDWQRKFVVDGRGWVSCPWSAYQIIIRKPAAGSPPAAGSCPSKTTCSSCTLLSSCGWCSVQNACKSGTSTASADSECSAARETWHWYVSATACMQRHVTSSQ